MEIYRSFTIYHSDIKGYWAAGPKSEEPFEGYETLDALKEAIDHFLKEQRKNS